MSRKLSRMPEPRLYLEVYGEVETGLPSTSRVQLTGSLGLLRLIDAVRGPPNVDQEPAFRL